MTTNSNLVLDDGSITLENLCDSILHINDNIQFDVVRQKRNFLVQTCFLCNKEMILGEGATIYGEKWYHKDCWQSVTKGESKR